MLTRISLPHSSSSGLLAEPILRIEEALDHLDTAIRSAQYWNENGDKDARIARLQAFRGNFIVKAAKVWDKVTTDSTDADARGEKIAANAFSGQLRDEVQAAIDVQD
jgi:hypothetical protein